MPYYNYRCRDCREKFTLYFETYAAYDEAKPTCIHCGSANLSQLVGRVSVAKSEETRMDSWSDPSALGALDENDPRSLGRWMRKMSRDTGEDLGPEFDEVVGRLEAGEDPESIEKSIPDLGADLGDSGNMDF